MSTFWPYVFQIPFFSGMPVMKGPVKGQVAVCMAPWPMMAALCPMGSSHRLLGLDFARHICSVTQAHQKSKHTNCSNRIIEQQIHRIAQVGRDLKRPLGLTFCGKREPRWDYLGSCPIESHNRILGWKGPKRSPSSNSPAIGRDVTH